VIPEEDLNPCVWDITNDNNCTELEEQGGCSVQDDWALWNCARVCGFCESYEEFNQTSDYVLTGDVACPTDRVVMLGILFIQATLDVICIPLLIIVLWRSFTMRTRTDPWKDPNFVRPLFFLIDLGMISSTIITPLLLLYGVIMIIMLIFCKSVIPGWRLTPGRKIIFMMYGSKVDIGEPESPYLISIMNNPTVNILTALGAILATITRDVLLPYYYILHISKGTQSANLSMVALAGSISMGILQIARYWLSIRSTLGAIVIEQDKASQSVGGDNGRRLDNDEQRVGPSSVELARNSTTTSRILGSDESTPTDQGPVITGDP